MLDEQPRPAFLSPARGIATLRANEHPRPFQLVTVQRELEITLRQRRIHIVDLGCPGPHVPQHDDARAIPRWDDALELAVIEGMIFDVHRQALGRGVE